MKYNSDYSVRLATLGALGGDTTKCYNSVYEIDLAILDAIEHGGGGGGMDYNQMKQLLASSGVTEILFIGNGSGETVTLDYDLISQIGKGGGDYICVNTIDELSGITDPKDGMLAYVGAHDVQEEALVLSVDYYNNGGDWCRFIANYSGTTAKVQFHENGRNINLESGHFLRNNDGWFWGIPDNRSELPADFVFDNSVEGVLVSNADGAEISEHNEYANTVMLYKYNGVLPTLTLDPDDVNNVVFVSSSVTTETVTRHYEAKGYYKYYADIQKWQPYQIYVENYDSAELQTLFGEYTTYFKPLMAYFKDGADWYRDSWKIGVAHIYDKYDGNPEWKISFCNVGRDYWGYCNVFEIRYFKWNGEQWRKEGSYRTDIPTPNTIREDMGRKIYTQSVNETDIYDGGLYSVGLNGTYSGVTISTTINFDATATSENHIATIYSDQSGKGLSEQLCEDGWLFTQGMGMSATTNAEWFVIDYIVNSDTDTKFAAVKIEDNGDNTFTVTYFLTNDNWRADYWDSDHNGQTDHYRFEYDNDRGYTWTVTEHQTLTVAPHLYTRICFTHKDNSNAHYIHKYI